MAIKIIKEIPMGRRLCVTGSRIKPATAAICMIEHEDGKVVRGVGILHPDTKHLFFAPATELAPDTLSRGMYIASKMFCIGDEAVRIAVMIAEGVNKDDPRLKDAKKYLSCDYDIESVRKEAAAQQLVPDEMIGIINKMRLEYSAIEKKVSPFFPKRRNEEQCEHFPIAA